MRSSFLKMLSLQTPFISPPPVIFLPRPLAAFFRSSCSPPSQSAISVRRAVSARTVLVLNVSFPLGRRQVGERLLRFPLRRWTKKNISPWHRAAVQRKQWHMVSFQGYSVSGRGGTSVLDGRQLSPFFKLKVVILLDLNGFGCVEKHKSFRLCSRNGPSKPIMWYFGIFPDLQMLLIPEICAT